MTTNLLAALLIFMAVALGTVALVLVMEVIRGWARQRELSRRLEPIAKGTGLRPRIAPGLLKQEPDERMGMFSVPAFAKIANLLEQGRMSWGVGTFLVLTVGLLFAFGFAALLLTGSLVAATIASVLGAFVPYIIARRRATMRLYRFEENFPEAIDLLTRAIRAGHPLSAGVRMVAEEAPDPINEEFNETFEQQRFGLPFEDALLGLTDRVDLVDVRIFATAVLVQREVGGNLAEVLDNLATTIRARFAIRRQLRVYTAQGRLSGYVLGALPIFVGFAIYLLDREYMLTLFSNSIGRFAVVLAVILQIFGYLWIRKIVNIEI
jgi:tight adherence protein B